jgi:signal peptidase II
MILRYAPFLIAAAIFLLDRITKLLIRSKVSFWDNITVIPRFFSIVHTENRGAAFGILSDSTSPLRPFFLIALSLGVMIFITVLLLKPGQGGLGSSWYLRIGLALVLGGAMGNVYDRVISGAVTDFLELYFGSYTFPAFNVADSAISVGAAFLLLDMWLGHLKQREHAPQTD